MRNLLCICNTYLQLIVYLQLRNSLFKHDYVELFISDHSRNASNIAANLQNMKIFDSIKYIETNDCDHGREQQISKLINIKNIVSGTNKNWNNYLSKQYYDEFIYFNLNVTSCELFSILFKRNPNIICSQLEEGILSYHMCFDKYSMPYKGQIKFAQAIRNFLKKPGLAEMTSQFYCFFPDYFESDRKCIQVQLTDDDMRGIGQNLTQIFGIKTEKLQYPQKYIFFSSICDFEGGEPIGEYQLAEKIASLVGKENLLIKSHPRDSRDIYEKNGFIVDKNSAAPWEALVLAFDFSKHIFITAISGSVIFGSAVLENAPQTLYLYKLCQNIEKNTNASNAVQSLESVFNKGRLFKNIKIVKNYQELSQMLFDE